MLHIGGSGGVFFGITAGGASSANEFVKLGNIQLVGSTASGIYMVDNSQTALSTAKIAGADIRYGTDAGSQLLSIGGRNISGVEHSTKNLILDFNRQSIAVGGAATGDASLNIGDVSKRIGDRFFTPTQVGQHLQFVIFLLVRQGENLWRKDWRWILVETRPLRVSRY